MSWGSFGANTGEMRRKQTYIKLNQINKTKNQAKKNIAKSLGANNVQFYYQANNFNRV